MVARLRLPLQCFVLTVVSGTAAAQWVQFQNQTGARISADPSRVTSDAAEKSFAWGDLDRDGDIDLVIARKQPFTTAGKEQAVLLLNQNGVLTDRTEDFADTSDVPGDEGFDTPTNTRHLVVVDVDNDGWLDVVTAPTISTGDPKHIGHPRVYHNRGCTGACNGTADWLGLRFENARIPAMLSASGQAGFNPCFCHVSAGDVTGDGYADLWFADYDNGCSQPGANFEDKLLVNLGELNPGFFFDATEGAFSDSSFPSSAFSASNIIDDVNSDSVNDIVKQAQSFVGTAFNDPFDPGFFDTFSNPYGGSAYFVSGGDLNNDDRLDLVVSDDGADRYLLNQGNGSDTISDFVSFVFSFAHTGPGGAANDDSFGGNSIAADLNRDGWRDVLITDVDVDIPGCDRRMHIYKNLGGTPGGNVNLQEQTTGASCQNLFNNPAACLVASIPANMLVGVHDVAVFDINGDTYLDLVVGRCNSTEVWMNQPPFAPAGGIDGHETSTQLTVARGPGADLSLAWGASCVLGDTSYEVYEGRLGQFTTHHPLTCSTGGSTAAQITPAAESSYYLIVPRNQGFEGSYGAASNGTPRQQGSAACLPMVAGPCPLEP